MSETSCNLYTKLSKLVHSLWNGNFYNLNLSFVVILVDNKCQDLSMHEVCKLFQIFILHGFTLTFQPGSGNIYSKIYT